MVKGSVLSARFGGDLTNSEYLDKFLEILPDQSSIVTCDAEISGRYQPGQVIKILKATVKVCYKSKPTILIFKTFIDNIEFICQVISCLQQLFVYVKIIVPTYSSFEGTECFLVCNSFKDDQAKVDIINWNSITPLSRYISLVPLLTDFVNKRNPGVPFQYARRNISKALLQCGVEMGFNSNLQESVSTLSLYDGYLVGKDHILKGLSEIREILIGFIDLHFNGIIRIKTGVRLSFSERVSMSQSFVTHIALDKYCEGLSNLYLISRMLTYSDQKQAWEGLLDEYENT